MPRGGDASARLRRLIERELDSPRPFEDALRELENEAGVSGSCLEFLEAKNRYERQASVVKSEELCLRRVGWKLIRPLFIVAVLGGAAFALQRKVDPTLGAGLFLGGAAALYVAIQVLLHRLAARSAQRLREVEASYRRTLEVLLEDRRS